MVLQLNTVQKWIAKFINHIDNNLDSKKDELIIQPRLSLELTKIISNLKDEK